MPILRKIENRRSRMIFVLATQTGLKYPVLCSLKVSDLMWPSGVPVECLAIRMRRNTKRHPYMRFALENVVRTAVKMYSGDWDLKQPDQFAFRRSPRRDKHISVRHTVREIQAGIEAVTDDPALTPASAQEYFRVCVSGRLQDDAYLRRVALGVRLPLDGPQWREVGEPAVFAAQRTAGQWLQLDEMHLFWEETKVKIRRNEL